VKSIEPNPDVMLPRNISGAPAVTIVVGAVKVLVGVIVAVGVVVGEVVIPMTEVSDPVALVATGVLVPNKEVLLTCTEVDADELESVDESVDVIDELGSVVVADELGSVDVADELGSADVADELSSVDVPDELGVIGTIVVGGAPPMVDPSAGLDTALSSLPLGVGMGSVELQ
jgi:hypothetical protein